MEERIKELLRKQGLHMSDLADRMGTDPSNLKKSLTNNPKLSTLQEAARALGVQLHELFTPNLPSRPKGVVFVDGRSYALVEMPCVVKIPTFGDHTRLRNDIKYFIKDSVAEEMINAFCGVVDGFELISLVYDCRQKAFYLTLYYSDAMSKTFIYDLLDYAEGDDGFNLEDVTREIINDIETAIPDEYKSHTPPSERALVQFDQESEF